MRVVRLVLGLLLFGAVVVAWQRREPVLDAYADEPVALEFRFDGLEFEIEPPDERSPSPLAVPRPPDTASVRLTPVRASTPPAPPTIAVGDVTFSGTVTGPDGPVAGAVVRLEHHGAAGTSSIDVPADELGMWELPSVTGGRWRVRAFVPDVFASVSPVVRFVGADYDPVLDLVVGPANTDPVLGWRGVPQMVIGEQGEVAVTVGRRRVDASGVIVVDPSPGVAVTLTAPAPGAARILVPSAVSLSTGAARFAISCDAIGATRAVATVSGPITDATTGTGSAILEVDLPTCVDPPPPPPDPATTVPDAGGTDG